MGLVQQAGNFATSSVASITVTMGSAPTSGNTIVAVITDSFGSSSALPISSIVSTNTTWTFDGGFTTVAGTQRFEFWHGVVSGVGGTSIVVTPTSNVTAFNVGCSEWSGLLSPTTLDGSPVFRNGTSIPAATGAFSTTGASDLVIAGCWNAAGISSSPGVPYTTLTAVNTMFMVYHFGAGSGLQPTASWNTVSAHNWINGIAAYQITAPAVGAPLSNIVLLGVGRN